MKECNLCGNPALKKRSIHVHDVIRGKEREKHGPNLCFAFMASAGHGMPRWEVGLCKACVVSLLDKLEVGA